MERMPSAVVRTPKRRPVARARLRGVKREVVELERWRPGWWLDMAECCLCWVFMLGEVGWIGED